MRNYLSWYVIVLYLIMPTSSFSKPSVREIAPVEKCLNISTNIPRECVSRHLKPRTLNACYQLSDTVYSSLSKEKVREYCFYSVSEFPTLRSCLDATKKFFMAENKDQALFECFRQFASQIDEKTCVSISKMMNYRERRQYLENHCYNM